jgi:hypothetical protein
MGMITDEVRAYIGLWSEMEVACDPVELGAVRRFAQAIMDEDPAYGAHADATGRYGGPIAPPLFPNHMMRRALGAPDPIQQNAGNPDFDGVVPGQGLPAIKPLAHLPVLNGGSEFEFLRYARLGETVTVRQRYADISEKQTSKGSMILVVTEAEISAGSGELLLRARRTAIRRVLA